MLAALAIMPTLAHEAPSGWSYPQDCCAGKDCRPLSCAAIIDHPDGSETALGLHFEREQVKISGDAQCHVCIGYSDMPIKKRFPHCIFIAPMN